ncbi:hypothetical protein SLEP1_g31093 [Rubroshorea leprosula]|uniref:Protein DETOXIFICATION n=1 Tax=Rubroshorea leprosula TaxID=152421 RepID=A0AAV5KB29_9ROSI|nr:hypothetical protein SLEP1_g31093 [Rubroshorea leprosula]
MQIKALNLSSSSTLLQNPNLKPSIPFKRSSPSSLAHAFHTSALPLLNLRISNHGSRRNRFVIGCVSRIQGITDNEKPEIGSDDPDLILVSEVEKEEKVIEVKKRTELANQSIWSQMKEIMMFSGPATGLWICAPLMSLISTAVVGQRSSTELAALGPGTVFCDNMNLLFMFLSIATSNMVATSLAKRDKNEVQHRISILLFVGLSCGFLMLLFTQFLGSWALTGFAGPKNAHIVPVASKYVQIRGLSWPAVLYGLVAQSASLGMKDSVGPLKALVVASAVNGIGHVVLCSLLGYGITGAAWATMASQLVAAYMMIEALNKKGYNAFAVSIPSPQEFLQILAIAAPVFITMFSKVAFYALMTYYATAMGTFTVAAHQTLPVAAKETVLHFRSSFPANILQFLLKTMKMYIKTLTRPPLSPFQNPNFKFSQSPIPSTYRLPFSSPTPRLRRFNLASSSCNFISGNHWNRLVSNCIHPGQEIVVDDGDASVTSSGEEENEVEEEVVVEVKREGLANLSIWNQVKEIMMFTGPAAGLWICGPLMSLIDTAVIGQGSSVELAALGPATVVCDYMSYIFMFLSIATSNMVATSLARRDKNDVQHQISILLFIGLTCGFLMLLFTRFFGAWALTAFTGSKNVHIVPAANSYVQIRGLAWPAILVGWIAQSASLGMRDSWGPLKALLASSVINGVGDIVLCSFLGYGIAGAAWATMISQVVAAYMMIQALNEKGYNAFAISVPSLNELLTVLALAAPVFVTMMSKVVFYSLLVYFATSMGTHTVAAHQVMIQTFAMCNVWSEPLSQTAQSFMPELLYGVNRSLPKARMLLKSLIIIGSTLGLLLASIGTLVPISFPNIFTHDQSVIQEMRKVLIPYFLALSVNSSTHSLEGTLLAGRDLKFMSLSMSGCLALGALVLLLVSNTGYGLPGCWYALMGFQWSRFFVALGRLLSPNGILYSEDLSRYKVGKLKSA